jgi:hypothetical protein
VLARVDGRTITAADLFDDTAAHAGPTWALERAVDDALITAELTRRHAAIDELAVIDAAAKLRARFRTAEEHDAYVDERYGNSLVLHRELRRELARDRLMGLVAPELPASDPTESRRARWSAFATFLGDLRAHAQVQILETPTAARSS